MSRRARVFVSAAMALGLLACAAAEDSRVRPGAEESSPAADEARFCAAWHAAMASADDSAYDAVLADPPAAVQDVAAVVRAAGKDGRDSPEVEDASDELLNWIELHCRPAVAGESRRRLAPPLGTGIRGLELCGTTMHPRSPRDDRFGMVLYGGAGGGDPYDGAMLGVLWNPAERYGGHGGDGEARPVTVRGRPGVAAPITVFQQTILPELGTVIAWTEGDHSLGLYGRSWPLDRAGDLVRIAESLQRADDGFRIPGAALPDGYREVFRGRPAVASLLPTASPLYSVRYQSAGEGLLDVEGFAMTEGEFGAFRFFTVGVDHGDVDGRRVLAGNAWHANGPAVVTWREADGLVVRIRGIGVPLDTARTVAARTRELTPAEWAALVEADDRCPRHPGGDQPSGGE